MYIENKSGGLDGPGRIGWVAISRTARMYHYRGRRLAKIGSGYKYNCIDEENGDRYWVSGPHKDGADKLYGGVVQIDEDARVEYWTKVRGQPALVGMTEYRAGAGTRSVGHTRRSERGARSGRAGR